MVDQHDIFIKKNDATCTFCNQVFSNKYNCTRHIKLHCKSKLTIVQSTMKTDEFKCDKCMKPFTRHWNMVRHSERCKGTTQPFECHICHEIFSSYASKSKHVKLCKCKHTPFIDNHEESEVDEEHSSSTKGCATININQTATTINNTNFTISVNLNNFGEESLDHITAEMLTKFAKEINYGLAKLIDTIHFNPNVPQNHNIRLENVKGQLVAVYQNNEWTIRDMNDTVKCMINKGCKLLTNHYNTSRELQKEDKEQHYGIISNRLNSISCKDRKTYFPTKRLIVASLHNHKKNT